MNCMNRIKAVSTPFLTSILNSYSQIFFSNNRLFAIILLIVSFFDLYAGLSGVIAVLITNGAASLIGFNKKNISAGFYGFNSLLVGLGIGITYQFTIEFFILLIFASLLTLLLTIMLEGVIGKYGLPFLSVSFLLGIWMVMLAAREFSSLAISERGVFTMNEMYALGGISLVRTYNWFTNLNLHESIVFYFKSLGAIFFQYHLFAGVLIAIGILIYSRIAFVLSLIGFYAAFLFYQLLGADINTIGYTYIGFNFILTAIAVGGLFIIPSGYSFLWVLLLTPLIAVITTSTGILLSTLQLSVLALPFNIIVLLFLYILKFRERGHMKPEVVGAQQYSPEKNLYTQQNYLNRFNPSFPVHLSLPFWGNYIVTQGHNGEYSHQGDWKNAWDFEIVDEKGNRFKNEGKFREDYYCFNKPVLAPADGWVEDIHNGIDDNEIGEINLDQNWGNTIIIKHNEQLFSKISHIKKGSFKVEKGSYVKKGNILAYCGNSGRSQVPHIHFQVQKEAFIGSSTIDYPFATYILEKKDHIELKSFDRPQKDEIVSNIVKNDALEKAFHFIPGQKMNIRLISNEKKEEKITWSVHADLHNNTYLLCKISNAKAYFRDTGDIFYFTHFEGDKNSLLFYFYLGAYKVPKGAYKNMTIEDHYPLSALNNPILIWLQDFLAPFYIFLDTKFTLSFESINETLSGSEIKFLSNAQVSSGKKINKKICFEFLIKNNTIDSFTIFEKDKHILVRWAE